MADLNNAMQIVTFQLGEEIYGIDIMEVKEIVDYSSIRDIPNAPAYVEGLFNLRGGIIPIISLHRRFHIQPSEDSLEKSLLILTIGGMNLGIVIDRILRVVSIEHGEIQEPPQVISSIGAEYIRGVVSRDDNYLIILDSLRLFDSDELQQISQYA
ncbi:MAG: chemotaxis protein CheW [Spirochaetales bacterium]|nr:MAG: chemotaxis protein CheW [Spirochaetales bacterium]